jgi:hypothetical protein
MEKNQDFGDVREHKQGEERSLQDMIEENLAAEQELAALLRSRISGEK